MQVVEHTRDEDGIPALDGSLGYLSCTTEAIYPGATTASWSVVWIGSQATMQLRRWSSSNAVSPGCRQQDFGRRPASVPPRAKTPQNPLCLTTADAGCPRSPRAL